jgi:hypothetical protein
MCTAYSMMGMMDYYPQPWSKNVWTPWVKYLTDKAPQCGVSEAAVVKMKKTYTAACTKHFQPSGSDIETLTHAFQDKSIDKLQVLGKTYLLLPRSFTADPSCLVASSGSHYVIVGASMTMYVIAQVKKTSPAADTEHVRNSVDVMRKMLAKLGKNGY